MARQPKFMPQRSRESKLPWRVNIPPQVSESGKRERFYFATKADALTFGEQQKIRIKNHGTATDLLTPAQREAATAAFQLLGDASPSRLIDIVRQHLELEKKKVSSVSVKNLCVRFTEAKAATSIHYRRQLRAALDILEPVKGRPVFEISPGDLDPLLTHFPCAARNAHLRVLKAAFNFAVKKEWCSANPVLKLEFSEIKRTEVDVLSNKDVKGLLGACIGEYRDLLPYHLFGIFAGIRPLELERMKWDHVRPDERHILLPPEVTKTGTRRVIEMERLLCIWVRWYRWNQGKLSGPIVEEKNLRRRLRQLREAAKIDEWIQDVMRHTYASNWLAKFENLDRLRANMGHRSDDVLWNHYHRAVLRKDAGIFWRLTPKEVLKPKPQGILARSI